MRTLYHVRPTPEQLALISNPRPGVQLIRGAAGSGKTTTALLMLRLLCNFYLSRRERLRLSNKVNILVLTFNRTLRGYIQELAEHESRALKRPEVSLTVSTFAKWAKDLLSPISMLGDAERLQKLKELSTNIPLQKNIVIDEVDYILGRFKSGQLADYLGCTRVGRGNSPRIDRNLRQQLIDEVISPYMKWKAGKKRPDWNDLAAILLQTPIQKPYDIIIADEVQDFSANEVRVLIRFASDPSSIVLILDAAQRIYPRGFTWVEAGVSITKSSRLKANHRNTKEISRFASPLLAGLEIGDDGTFPDFDSCVRSGPMPLVLKGLYSQQVTYVLNHIASKFDLSRESVAFLKPLGGGWFDYLKNALNEHSLRFVEITREQEWPRGPENIALSTMYSAKGLEFDHVIVIGLNEELTPHGAAEGDTTLENLRRLLAMAITRARESVVVGYKPEEASTLVSFLDSSTYQEVCL
jgi:superfamily I DNA/RNA helicase